MKKEDSVLISQEHFEDIYSLENVDVNTVRVMSAKKNEEEKEQKKTSKGTLSQEEQLEFDFGSNYREWMESLSLEEPLSVLDLSYHAYKALQTNKKYKIHDIVNIKDGEWASLSGLGQGHIDEIKQKLSEYIDQDSLYRCYNVDFSSLLYYAYENLDHEKAFLALQRYGLADFVSLTISEKTQVSHLSSEKKQILGQHGLEEMCTKEKRSFIQNKLEEIISTFVKPWIGRRTSIASENEIIERILSVSKDHVVTRKVWNFLQETYWQDESLLGDFLYLVDTGVYCSEEFVSLEYKSIMRLAQSYFYERHIKYPLEELIRHIERRHAHKWHGFSEGFVAKVLRLSSQFLVGKDRSGQKIVVKN
jgi:hypothetical protein